MRQLQSRVSQRVSDDRAEEDLPPGVRAAACPAWAFGRRFKQGTSCSSSGEDGVGRILGVCGSAFCATLERVKEEGFLRPGATEAAMRAVLKRPKGAVLVGRVVLMLVESLCDDGVLSKVGAFLDRGTGRDMH